MRQIRWVSVALMLMAIGNAGVMSQPPQTPPPAPAPAAPAPSEQPDRVGQQLRSIDALLRDIDGKVIDIKAAIVVTPTDERSGKDNSEGIFSFKRILGDQISNVVWAIITFFWEFIGFKKGNGTIAGLIFSTIGNVLSLYWAWLRYGPKRSRPAEMPTWLKGLVFTYFVFGAIALTASTYTSAAATSVPVVRMDVSGLERQLQSIQTDLGRLRSGGDPGKVVVPASPDGQTLDKLGARIEQLAQSVERHDARIPSSGTGWHLLLLFTMIFLAVIVVARTKVEDR